MSGTVLFERRLPLAWTALSADAQNNSTENNHLIFALLDSSDEIVLRNQDKELAADLQRMETKLNVIMQLLGMLLQGGQSHPPEQLIRFSSDTLAWQTESPLEPGCLLALSLYPEASIPLAVHFTVRVLSHGEGWLTTELQDLSEEERAIWSRWVFRQHRRQVALKRTHIPSESV